MATKRNAESLFESFCDAQGICWERVPTGDTATPDYLLSVSGQKIYFEVKQIDADEAFDTAKGVTSRTVGSHVRRKITDSRKQLQTAANAGVPGVLLVYNNLDPTQRFGTEPHDFITAMYGEMTLVLKNNQNRDSFYGRNSSLREEHNTSFSAIGHLYHSEMGLGIKLYENVYARHRLNFATLPPCIEVVRIEVTESVT